MALKEQTSSFEPKPFGRYVLMDKLAVGGMAEIYKAKTYGVDGFEKVLAVKRILPHCAADKDFINMLVDEAKLTVLLSHANIVQVYDLGKVGDDYFISMEYISGTNLREVMGRFQEQSERFPEEIAVYVMSEVCKGLDYAHRKTDSGGNPLNIVHRDISPQNILLSYEGEVKIVDFGIAKAAMNVSHTMAGILKGKIAYMSPEQALGKPVDHRTDIFSAGVVLYEMLTGEKLFTGETQFEVLNQIRTTRVNTMMLPDHIPGPLKGIIAKALAYNTKDRYQSAGDFQLDLTKFLYSSYIDFSPRQLSAQVSRLFKGEIKKREPQVSIDEKTRSVLVKQAGLENIMVHGTAKASPNLPVDTAVSGVFVSPSARKTRLILSVTGGAVAALLLGWFVTAHFLKGGPKPAVEKAAVTPPAEALPTEETGSLQVETDPSGAKILLNGNDTGLVSPATVPKLALGEEYQIALLHDNYRQMTKTVPVTSTEPVKLKESLEPLARGVIEIDSSPRGAKVLLDDRDTSLVTPAKIDNLEIKKSYAVKLSLPDYSEWSGSVDLKDFEPVKLQAALTPVTATPPGTFPQPPAVTAPAPVSSPPPAPTLSYGKIRVESSPPGARILLNGSGTGKVTPATLEKLESGKRVSIAVAKKGYKDWGRTVTVEKDRTASLTATLTEIEPEPVRPTPPAPPVEASLPPSPPEPVNEQAEPVRESVVSGKPGNLSIGSDPSGAEVYINAEYKGTTPIKVANVPPGNVKVALSKEGYMRQSTMVKLSPGESKSLGTIRLGGQFGEIVVKSSPPGATVIFDGERTTRTPVTIRRVPRESAHTLRVELDGYRTWDTSVNLRDQESKKYDVLLEKE